MSGGWSGGYDANISSSLNVSNDKKPILGRETDCYVALFYSGMIGAIKRCRQWVVESRNGLIKRNTVFLLILFSLSRVPFELHFSILSHLRFLFYAWQLIIQKKLYSTVKYRNIYIYHRFVQGVGDIQLFYVAANSFW
jgi:hypothetical protein